MDTPTGCTTRIAVVGLVVMQLAATVVDARNFVIGPAGHSFGEAPVPGYVLATLHDMQSGAFLQDYNALGLRANSQSQVYPSTRCPFVAVRDGILALGSVLDSSVTPLAPFSQSELPQLGNRLTNPVWLGLLNATTFTSYSYVGPFNASFVDQLFVASLEQLGEGVTCDYDSSHMAVYVRAVFIVGGFGADFPSPPSPNSELATVADLQSDVFVEAYNGVGLTDMGESVENGCLVLRLLSGYIAISSTAYLSPYTANGVIQSGPQLTNPVWLGTGPWGSVPNEYIGPLNGTTLNQLTALRDAPVSCRQAGNRNAWGIYKRHPYLPPPPAHGNCYEVEIQGSYDLPGDQICLADRWNYYMRINETYDTIGLNSLNECGGTYNAHGMQLQPYNDTFLVGRTTGATSCDCSNVTNWGFVPLNNSGQSYMAQLCYVTVDEFNFCEVLIEVKSGPVKCPPPP